MKLKHFLFIDHFDEKDSQSLFVGHLSSGITSSEILLDSIASTLHFPGYFGQNWNALYDCLRDFGWLNQKNVVLVHDEIPNIPEEELAIYLEVLHDAVEDWKEGEDHQLQVVFPVSAKEKVISILKG